MSTPEDLPTHPTQQDNYERINPLLWSCNLTADRCLRSAAIHATFLTLSHYKTTGKDNGAAHLSYPFSCSYFCLLCTAVTWCTGSLPQYIREITVHNVHQCHKADVIIDKWILCEI